MATIGAPLDGSAPVITDFPIWLAETARIPTLALPGRDPGGRPGPRPGSAVRGEVLVVDHAGPRRMARDPGWTRPAAACFHEVLLPVPDDPADAAAIEGIRVFRIGCEGTAVRTAANGAARRSP